MFFMSKKGSERWLNKEIHGQINDIAVIQKDKFTFFKLDTTWYWVTNTDLKVNFWRLCNSFNLAC